MFEMIERAIASGHFRLRPSTLIELNRLAVVGLVAAPGAFRAGEMTIDGSRHRPPQSQDVPNHVDDLCDYITENWSKCSPVHLAAFVLWRLNWIHPFEDGNGRTARAASYLALCAKLGQKLPGTRTIPEVIAADKAPYYAALEAADALWKTGKLDLSQTEQLLTSCLAAQLLDVVKRASGSNAPQEAPREQPRAPSTPAPAASALAQARKPRVFIGSSTEGHEVAEAISWPRIRC